MPPKAFLRSLLLASTLSFVAPVLLIGAAIVALTLTTYIPMLEAVGNLLVAHLLNILATFGNGHAFEGILVIGCACAFVGALFDTYAYYYRYLRNG